MIGGVYGLRSVVFAVCYLALMNNLIFARQVDIDSLVKKEAAIEYEYIRNHIDFYRQNEMPNALKSQAFDPSALILSTDRDPLDVLYRRTAALLQHLQNLQDAPDLDVQREHLKSLQKEMSGIDLEDAAERRQVFDRLIRLRRKVALKNPLLDFNRLIFLTHHKARYDHMVDQYFGFHAKPGGGIYVLENPFGDSPRVRSLLDDKVRSGRLAGQTLDSGSFISLELDYDANTIYFAWTQAREALEPFRGDTGGKWFVQDLFDENGITSYWNLESTYHIFKVNADGSNLVQLTDGPWNDFDPCVLPNGRIVFISERRGGYLRCGARPDPTYTLHAMMADGSDIIPLSYHETHEWHPSVSHDGKIVYTRWDYVDRDSDIAHHLWFCFPDGRDPRSFHGNYPHVREHRPWMEMSPRAIPGSGKYVAVSAPHHGQAYGSIVLIDHLLQDDGSMGQVCRLTPEAHFPESEKAPGVPHDPANGRHKPKGEVYGSPWPLDENFYLCVFDPEQQDYRLTLLDKFGNRVLIYDDPQAPCLDPIPFVPRNRPPVIPNQTTQALADRDSGSDRYEATIAVTNVYDSDQPWPENTDITALRIVQLFPKTTRQAAEPNIGIGDQSLARGVLGTVPVEEDGSAFFTAPVGIPVYFQALDEKGMAVQTMRSLTYVHRGENLTCQGCHEPKQQSVSNSISAVPIAMTRAPSKIEPDVKGSWPLSFPRLVQPVIDDKCAGCHAEHEKAPDFTHDRGEHGWSQTYHTLAPLGWFKSGGNGALEENEKSYSVPGEIGAQASKLYALLKDHHEVNLSDEDLYRITLWLDCNSTFYGAYHQSTDQAIGERIVPFLY
ncbi:hypothetical protein GF406_06500 [candidate division KSB1 bacterium]|nr:hypothetical protein [candidate division KSB1 bacterium]